jgi:hypothetical protein
MREVQAQLNRRNRIHASILLVIGAGAWLVVGMYALAWRWAFARNRAYGNPST